MRIDALHDEKALLDVLLEIEKRGRVNEVIVLPLPVVCQSQLDSDASSRSAQTEALVEVEWVAYGMVAEIDSRRTLAGESWAENQKNAWDGCWDGRGGSVA